MQAQSPQLVRHPTDVHAKPIGLVVADSHPVTLVGIERLFSLERDVRVLAACRDANAVLRAVRTHRPDVLVLDLRIEAQGALSIISTLNQEAVPVCAVLLTATITADEMLEAVRLGIRGVLLKQMPSHMLVQCVRKVHSGDVWLEKSSVNGALLKMMKRDVNSQEIATILTPRELQISRLVATGQRNKEIADRLRISEGTVKIHLHKVFEKLELKGRLELTLYLRDKGLI